MFQSGNLVPALTAADQVRLPMTISTEREHRDPMALLAEVGMDHKADRRPHELSGGERQRVGIAEHQVATVMVTHDHNVLGHCDRVLEMVDGRLEPHGS